MNRCQECEEVFKYDRKGVRQQEHYNRFHSLPNKTKNEKIRLNACHQIVLIVKGDNSWEDYFKQNKKDDSWFRDGKILQKFELDNNIEFQYCKSNEEISFMEIKTSLWKKIKKLCTHFQGSVKQ